MDAYELFEILASYYKYDMKDIIESINNLVCEMDNSPNKFIYELSKRLEEHCEDTDYCPLCGDRVVTKYSFEDRGEYLGFPCRENVPLSVECPSCDYYKEL